MRLYDSIKSRNEMTREDVYVVDKFYINVILWWPSVSRVEEFFITYSDECWIIFPKVSTGGAMRLKSGSAKFEHSLILILGHLHSYLCI